MEKQSIAFPELRQVARKMRAAGLNSIELKGKNWSAHMKFEAARSSADAAQPATAALTSLTAKPAPTTIFAPMPGKILLQHPLSGVAYAQPGQQVKQDDLLALVQIGSLYLPVNSPADGMLVAISVKQNQRVEYGSEVALLSAAEAV